MYNIFEKVLARFWSIYGPIFEESRPFGQNRSNIWKKGLIFGKKGPIFGINRSNIWNKYLGQILGKIGQIFVKK